MTQYEKIKRMSAYDLSEWLFVFGLNCEGMSKGDIYRELTKDDEIHSLSELRRVSIQSDV